MKLDMMLEVDETFMMIWLSRSTKVWVKVMRWPQSPIGTIFWVLIPKSDSSLRCWSKICCTNFMQFVHDIM